MLGSIRNLILLPVFFSFMLSGCSSVPSIKDVSYSDGAIVSTLSSSVSLSYSSSEKSISGSGIIMYQKPAQFRVVVLSPFGSVLQEIFIHNQDITIVDPGNKLAFKGLLAELPEQSYFSGWKYIHWLVDNDIPLRANGDKTVERVGSHGESERVVFENGLVSEKSTARGSSVKYRRYTTVQGVALPLEIICETAGKDKLTVKFDDPEVNTSLAHETFIPQISNFKLYPLSLLYQQ